MTLSQGLRYPMPLSIALVIEIRCKRIEVKNLKFFSSEIGLKAHYI